MFAFFSQKNDKKSIQYKKWVLKEVCFQHFKYTPSNLLEKKYLETRGLISIQTFFAKGCGWPLSYLIPERCCHTVEVGSEFFRVAKKWVGTTFRSPFFVEEPTGVVIKVVTKSHVFRFRLKQKDESLLLNSWLSPTFKPAILWDLNPASTRNKVANEGRKIRNPLQVLLMSSLLVTRNWGEWFDWWRDQKQLWIVFFFWQCFITPVMSLVYIWVFPKIVVPPKWMVYNGKRY